MYVPPAFAQPDVSELHRVISAYSFATLVSADAGRPVASHLPLLLDADRGPRGTLVGHLARANDQWRTADGLSVLAIFHGPHAYVSPDWYAEPNVVPTWNYVAVHAVGTLRVIDDADWLRELVRRMVDVYEAPRTTPWRMESQGAGFTDRLLAAIVGFEIPVDSLEGKWKLSQNHSPQRRQRVVARLREEGDHDAQRIAELMAAGLASPPN